MTNDELEQLSQRVADKYEIAAYVVTGRTLDIREGYTDHMLRLDQDSERCFDLAVEHELCIHYYDDFLDVICWIDNNHSHSFYEYYKDHPTKQQAVRVAILKELLEVE